MTRLARMLKWLAAAAVGVVVGVAIPMRRVAGTDMAPSLVPGDFVWLLPVHDLSPGDVVTMKDPQDPDRTVLRRLIAGAGQRVMWDEGGLRVNGKRVRQQEPETEPGGWKTVMETLWSRPPAVATQWRVRELDRDNTWKADVIEVPDGSWYVLADDRARAIDSRWWGLVKDEDIRGVLRLRVGAKDAHRAAYQVLKGTGPWQPAPKPKPQ